jgi:hypothetical protein
VTPHYDDVFRLRDRAEQAEATLALHVADLSQLADAHAEETAGYEAQLRDRARVVAALEKELVRREQLVKELVASLEDSREGASAPVFEAAPPSLGRPASRPAPGPSREAAAERAATEAELARLRRKLDELASEVARREGELVARGWRITELENQLASRERGPDQPARAAGGEREREVRPGDAGDELARAQAELDALRQALTQEHAARLAAESGEELQRARSELARQAVLIEQMRALRDDPRRTTS